jgi:hypothetical protein
VLILGAVLWVIAAVAVLVAVIQQRRWHQMAAAETLTCAQLREQADIMKELGGGGGTFRRVCEVVGAAQPGRDGPDTAPMSEVAAVWHRHQVTRRYERYVNRSNGQRRLERGEEVVSRFSSAAPFSVTDDTGSIVVTPDGASVDRPERVHSDFRRGGSSAGLTALGITINLGSVDGTIGFRTEEWAIRPGTSLYVLGEVTDHGGELRIGKPDKGRFIISTRSEAELTARARRTQRAAMVTAAVAGAAGLVALVAGLI